MHVTFRVCTCSDAWTCCACAAAEPLLKCSRTLCAEPWYLKLNPNGRIPTLIDHDEGDFAVWESGALQSGQLALGLARSSSFVSV
jgi:Glutathione S-transferase, N-terminal domain